MTDTDLLVLCYHAVSENWPASLSVTPRRFESQIQLLASRGYEGTTFTRAARGDLRGRAVAVTFDDGYRSVYELARPILDSYGIPATVFIPTRLMQGQRRLTWAGIDSWLGGPHESELEPMSVEELRLLAGSGWEIGSHSLTHPRLPQLDDGELRDQLTTSRRECTEMVGVECTSIAYPYGAVDGRVLRASEGAGYSAAALLSSYRVQASNFARQRVGVYHADGPTIFRLKISPLTRRLPRRARPAIDYGSRLLRRR
ncbi:MAG TPA: polysaccharide deacetylase family protein [Solirubrobacterales bacterium]